MVLSPSPLRSLRAEPDAVEGLRPSWDLLQEAISNRRKLKANESDVLFKKAEGEEALIRIFLVLARARWTNACLEIRRISYRLYLRSAA